MENFRPIVCRGKRIDTDEWIAGVLYNDENSVYILVDLSTDLPDPLSGPVTSTIRIFPVKPDTVGQLCFYSKDQGYVFEGDFVQICTGRICEVTYLSSPSYQGFDLKAVDNIDRPTPPPSILWKDLEVIGNKWDGVVNRKIESK